MQVAREIAYANRDPRKVGDMKISFSKQVVEQKPQKMTRKQAAEASRASWGGIVPMEKKNG